MNRQSASFLYHIKRNEIRQPRKTLALLMNIVYNLLVNYTILLICLNRRVCYVQNNVH